MSALGVVAFVQIARNFDASIRRIAINRVAVEFNFSLGRSVRIYYLTLNCSLSPDPQLSLRAGRDQFCGIDIISSGFDYP